MPQSSEGFANLPHANSRAGTTEATSPEQAVLQAQPRAQTPTAPSPQEQRGSRLPRRLTYPSPRPLARPQRQPLLLHPADGLERTQEANSLTFTNPISLLSSRSAASLLRSFLPPT